MNVLQYAGLAVTVGLFFVTHFITLFKWINAMSDSIKEVTIKMEERTNAIMSDLRKVNASLEALATAGIRIGNVESRVTDHELRIRVIERDVALFANVRKENGE